MPFLKSTNLDEGIYLTVSDYVSKGYILYKDVYENKPPIFFFLNAAFIKLFGYQVITFRILNIFLMALAAILLFKIIKKFCSDNKMAYLGSVIFIVFSSIPLYEIFWIMTESYLLVFEMLAFYFLLSGIIVTSNTTRYYMVLAGIFSGCSILIRQTAFLFGIIMSFFIILLGKNEKKIRSQIIPYMIGIALPFLPVFFYFSFNQSIDELFYWTLIEPLHFIKITQEIGAISGELKSMWILEVLTVSFPLILFTLVSLIKSLKVRHKKMIKFSLIWVISVLFVNFNVVSGFHHEYAEILIPLSMGSVFGVKYMFQAIKKSSRCVKISIILFLILLLSSWSILTSEIINKYEYKNNDLEIITEVTTYLQYLSDDETIYVYETMWPKNSLYFYFLSQKFPPLKRLFYFPPFISREEASLLIDSLEKSKTPIVILIGPKPPFIEANNIYSYILTHYLPSAQICSYSPYTWLPNQTITVLKRIEGHEFKELMVLEVRKWVPINANLSLRPTEHVIEASYNFENTNWFSLLYTLDEPLDITNNKFYLFVGVYGTMSSNIIQIDLVDKSGNYCRFEIIDMYQGYIEFYIPLERDLFISQTQFQTDFKNINAIHISLANFGDFSEKGIFQLFKPAILIKN